LVLEIIENENLVENSRVVGEFLLNGLKQLEQKYPDHISARGKGLMCAFDLKDGASRDWLRSAV
jgi:L-lysine 6-transaminase